MGPLKNKLKKWLSKGLITPAQEKAILKYEKNSGINSLWSLYGFLLVSACSISFGIAALIAANWHFIPVYAKLTGYFVFLSGTAFLALKIKIKNKSALWFEILVVVFMILCQVGIGLIAQIYHLEGESYQALFLWTFITSGLMMSSSKKFTINLWLIGLYIALISWKEPPIELKIDCLIPLVFFLLAMAFHNRKIAEAFPFLLSKRKVFETWAVFTGLISLVSLNSFNFFENKTISLFLWEYCLLFAMGLILFLTVIFSDYKKIQKILLSYILILFFIFFLFIADVSQKLTLLNMSLSVLILILASFLSLTFERSGLFMLFIVSAIARVFFFYMETYKNLTLTGFILILTGLIIIFMFQLFRKNKEQFKQWIGQLE